MVNPTRAVDEGYLNFLLEMVLDERKQRFEEVLAQRTRHITIVLEDIFQSQNASAVLRSCDLTGVQDVHIIENKYAFDIHPDIVLGSAKWLSLYRYNATANNTLDALSGLKRAGYIIVAASPHQQSHTIEDLPLDKPMAIMLGTERRGLSAEAMEMADTHVTIPMVGFTESFNVSVSAALLLFNLTQRLRRSAVHWELTENDRNEVLLEWCRHSVKRIEVVERNYFSKIKPDMAV
ncbi:MAG: RNA methyltransferase [Bacteroidales bacterium]|nr:RNA methyltransferase [Bacteroidales bacterium]